MGKVNQPTATWEVIEHAKHGKHGTRGVSHPAGGGVLKVKTQTRRHFSPASMIVAASNWL